MGDEWIIPVYGLAILFIIAGVLNFTITPFIEEGVITNDTQTNFSLQLQDYVRNGYEYNITDWLGFTLSVPIPTPFSILGTSVQDFVITQIIILDFIPAWIQIPLIIVGLVAFIYLIILIITWFIPG